MRMDLDKFLKVFLEEAQEGLEVMEAGLLELESPTASDPETIHSIFRAAHSIKGGSGSFGFEEIMAFTHLLETLLDEMRSGKRDIAPPATTCLLESVDVLRGMLAARQHGQMDAPERAQRVSKMLEALLSAAPVHTGWKIHFRPHRHMLCTGNEPLRMIAELEQLGTLEVEALVDDVLALSEIDPVDCHIAWNLTVYSAATEQQIRDVFDWVEGDCDLTIAPLVPVAEPTRQIEAVREIPTKTTDTTSLRVGTEKVDAIIDLVGELVITQSMLSQIGEHFDLSMVEKLRDGLAQLARNTRELQETVLKIRMLPASYCFSRFPRLVHDLSAKLGKQIQLRICGEQTELDKTVLEKINEPLLHLIRNAIDHGIETPEQRRVSGKPATGTIQLTASHRGGSIVIELSDDGMGLNHDRILAKARERGIVGANEVLPPERIEELIFAPGFSTAGEITDVSGRGVGMDVVRRNIKELGGNIEIVNSPGTGAKFIIRLPLTLAILDGQIIRIGGQQFVVPLVSIIESVQIRSNQISSISGGAQLYRLRDQYLPILRLHNILGIPAGTTRLEDGLLMVVDDSGIPAGLFVDDLLSQQQVVIKSMETNFRRVEGISGATILGDGTVAMILDVPGILNLSRHATAAA